VSGAELGAMGVTEFQWLLQGLSSKSRFVQAWGDAPKHVYDPDEIEAIKAKARR
jgi:hypothetical protein